MTRKKKISISIFTGVLYFLVSIHLLFTIIDVSPKNAIQNLLKSSPLYTNSYYTEFFEQGWGFFAPNIEKNYVDFLVRFAINKSSKTRNRCITPYEDITQLADKLVTHHMIPNYSNREITSLTIPFTEVIQGMLKANLKKKSESLATIIQNKDLSSLLNEALHSSTVPLSLKRNFLSLEDLFYRVITQRYSKMYPCDIALASDMQIRVANVPMPKIGVKNYTPQLSFSYYTFPWYRILRKDKSV